jgi:5-methyltetrahydropteroyltriglutamate--homocysteine methyltransferase
MQNIDEKMFSLRSHYSERKNAQQKPQSLPVLSTTTLGSFPQTSEIRKAQADFKKEFFRI